MHVLNESYQSRYFLLLFLSYINLYYNLLIYNLTQHNPNLTQHNPNLTQHNPNLTQRNPSPSQISQNLPRINPNMSRLIPNLSPLNSNLTQLNRNSSQLQLCILVHPAIEMTVSGGVGYQLEDDRSQCCLT